MSLVKKGVVLLMVVIMVLFSVVCLNSKIEGKFEVQVKVVLVEKNGDKIVICFWYVMGGKI